MIIGHRRLGILFAVLAFVIGSASFGLAEDGANNINIALWGAADPETKAFVGAVEYERAITGKFAVVGRLGALNYDWDDDDDEEDGDGFGGEVGVRFYLGGESRNLFLGGNLGIWGSDWDFIDDQGRPSQLRGEGSSTALNASFDVGYRFQLNDTVSIVPSGKIGSFLSLDDDCKVIAGASGECDRDTQLGFYAAVGCHVGFRF